MGSLALPIASYELATQVASCARLLNCYSSPAPQGGKSASILSRPSGITQTAELSVVDGAVCRGACVMNGTLYVVAANKVWKVLANWTYSDVGTISGSGRVRMATNGTQLVIVRPSDGAGFVCNGTSTTQIADATFVGWGAGDVAFIHRYFAFRRINTGQFFNSALNDGTTYNALDIAEAESIPDDLLALTVDHEEILLFGTASVETWYDAANDVGSPFSKSPGGVVTLGIAGTDCHGQQDNSTFWLANDRTIRRLAGITPQKVSSLGVDSVLQRMTQVSDCYTVSFTQEGHMFIAFTFPFEGRTFVYDCTVQQWHERQSLGYGSWRPAQIVECYGKQVVIDSRSAKIGYMNPAEKQEFEEPQVMSFTFQAVYAQNRLAIHRRLDLILNSGYGLLSGQGSEPLITLEISDDGGNIFRTLPTKSLGLRGIYGYKVFWDRLGSSPQRVYRMSISDPIQSMVVDAQLTADGARW